MKFTKYRLGELGRIVTGKTPNTSNPALWNGDVQFVTPEELQHGKNILQTERHLTQQGVKSIRGAFIPAESVCVCRALGILVMSQKRFTHALLTNRSIQLFQAVRTRLISSTIN